MTRQQGEIASFAIMLAAAAVITAIVSWQAVVGFVVGVTTTLVAAAIVNVNFE